MGRVRVATFVVAAALGGLAGVLLGPLAAVRFNEGLPLMLRGLIGASLGGLTSVGGAVAGGLFLGLAESLAVTYVSSQLKTPVAFGVLVLILVLRPTGFGQKAVV